jgi:hypothetical protein
MKIKRSRSTMYFLNRAFGDNKKEEIIQWMSEAATDPGIDPIHARGVTGAQYVFHRSEFPESHLLWCAEYLRKRAERRRDKLPTKYEISKRDLTGLAAEHARRVSGRDQLIAQTIRDIRDRRRCDQPKHVLQMVIRVIIREYPLLDLEKFAKRLAHSVKSGRISWNYLKRVKKESLI